MINYTWTIEDVIVTPTVTIGDDAFTDVIHTIRWKCVGTEGSYSEFEEQSWSVDFNNTGSFTSLDSLDIDVVLGWLMNADERNNQERKIAGYIEAKKNTKNIG
jgi:hypothetical protein|tara:strand:+ start:3137 stop:3445 length:309 start_codon:yes stop_codon:yes gene_type:complete